MMELPVDNNVEISPRGVGNRRRVESIFLPDEDDNNDRGSDGIDGGAMSNLTACISSTCDGNDGDKAGQDGPRDTDDDLNLSKAFDEQLSVETSASGGGSDGGELPTASVMTLSASGDSESDLMSDDDWRLNKRHVFIISEAGKPIYSRHGNEDKLATLYGLLQVLVSVVQDNGDIIKCIKIGDTQVVFLLKSPLIFVCVARKGEAISQIQNHLMYYYNQIVGILTSKQLEQIYEKRRNYDLRRLLGTGSERLLHNLGDMLDRDPMFLIGAVKCLPLASSVRDSISSAIISSLSKVKNVVFAILLANNQLVSLVRMKKCFMHPVDLHLLINLIDSSESFKTAESWTPIVLPRFDSSGFLHAHVSYLSDECQACLLILTVDRNSFFTLSEAKQKAVEKLRKANCLDAINTSMSKPWPSMSFINIPEVRHFLYKSRAIAQYSEPVWEMPYDSPLRLYETYARMHSRLHGQTRPLKLMYMVDEKENWLGWLTTNFELYVAFEPLTKKNKAIAAVDKILNWVKKENDRVFITSSPTF